MRLHFLPFAAYLKLYFYIKLFTLLSGSDMINLLLFRLAKNTERIEKCNDFIQILVKLLKSLGVKIINQNPCAK